MGQDYQMIKDVYSFLNQQMKRFEKTVELQPAIDHLLESVGNYFSANLVQLYKKEDGRCHLASEWRVRDDEADEWIKKSIDQIDVELERKQYILFGKEKNRLFTIPLFDGEKLIAVLAIMNPSEEKRDALVEIADMFGNWLANRLAKRDYLNRYNRVQKLLSGLGNDYTAVYIINI